MYKYMYKIQVYNDKQGKEAKTNKNQGSEIKKKCLQESQWALLSQERMPRSQSEVLLKYAVFRKMLHERVSWVASVRRLPISRISLRVSLPQSPCVSKATA